MNNKQNTILTLKSARGQALPYFMSMMVVLIMCWMMMINAAKLLSDRMMLQNAADNTAISFSVMKARILNILGLMNYATGLALSTGAYPMAVHVPMYDLEYMGSFSDYECRKKRFEGGTEKKNGVLDLKKKLNKFRKAQANFIKVSLIGAFLKSLDVGWNQQKNSKGESTGADFAIPVPQQLYYAASGLIAKPSFSTAAALKAAVAKALTGRPEEFLGLKYNDKKINFHSTKNWGVGKIPFVIKRHAHFVLPNKLSLSHKFTWLITAADFYKQKTFAVACKLSASDSNKGYPIGSRFFGDIKWPSMVTVAAAANYSPKGAMFPSKSGTSTGIPKELIIVAAGVQAGALASMMSVAGDVGSLPIIGGPLGGIVAAGAAAVTVVAVKNLKEAIEGEENPIKRYEKATEDGAGWDAHLVPTGIKGIKH